MPKEPPLIQRIGEHFLGEWLDKPTPASLELLVVKGERLSVIDYKRTNFVYELLTRKGERYKRINGSVFGWPTLPVTSETTKQHLRGTIREYLRPKEVEELNQRRNDPKVAEELKAALKDSRIMILPYCMGIMGTDLDVARKLLYVPGGSAAEADGVLNGYRNRVTGVLQPLRLHCDYKIRPIIKGQIELRSY
ncbi:MAG: hypothetical protein AABX04_05105 [Nanoarchaeota archaeon]